MRLYEISEEFWGTSAAGCLVMARATKRFLLAHRSPHVAQPGTWGLFGGRTEEGETPEMVARREFKEETGVSLPNRLIPLYVFDAPNFNYHNFLAISADEFDLHLDWETAGYRWCEFGDWPEPMHFGLKALLADSKSIRIIRRVAKPDTVKEAVLDLSPRKVDLGKVIVHVNPPPDDMEQILDASKRNMLRALATPGYFAAWDAHDAVHQEVQMSMPSLSDSKRYIIGGHAGRPNENFPYRLGRLACWVLRDTHKVEPWQLPHQMKVSLGVKL